MVTKSNSGGTAQYGWGFENRLISAVVPNGTVSFTYDSFGRRIRKVFTEGTTSTTTNYLYDGANDVMEVDQNGNTLARYTQGAGIDEPLAEFRSSTPGFYQQDGLGSVTSLSSSAGAFGNTSVYRAFGNLASSTGSTVNPFQYTGRDYDSETGLRYYRARYYDSNIGRFVSEDPARFKGGINLYAYVVNSPTEYVDPNGRVRIHGNWCGPNWMGGRIEPYDLSHDISGPDGPYYKNPIDYTDSICKDHDICYYYCRQDNKCDQGARRDCMRRCDNELIYYLTRFPSAYEGPIDALAGAVVAAGIAADSYYPSAGDNDPSCPGCKYAKNNKNKLK